MGVHDQWNAQAYEEEWPDWYGPGGVGNAHADLAEFANPAGELPVGVVALTEDGGPVGVASLKATSIPLDRPLTPWAAAGFVLPRYRRRGVGARLLSGLMREAARLDFPWVHCATATAVTLLRREGWDWMCEVLHDGQVLTVFRRRVVPAPRSAVDS